MEDDLTALLGGDPDMAVLAGEVLGEPQYELPDQSRLGEYVKLVEDAAWQLTRAQDWAKRNRKYYDGEPFDDDQIRVLKERGQQPFHTQMFKKAINGVVGVAAAGAVDPKVFPRRSGPEALDAADVATKALRQVVEEARLDTVVRATAFRDMLLEHVAAVEIEWDGEEIRPNVLKPHQLIYDPSSLELDFSDARFLGYSKWLWPDDLYGIYPEVEGRVLASDVPVTQTLAAEDRPRFQWTDRLRRINVVTLYHRERGRWQRCVFTRDVVLEAGESPYVCNRGRPACPIIARSVYIDGDNNRYGTANDLIDVTDTINKQTSKLTWWMSANQLQETEMAAPEDREAARKEAVRPDGVIPAGYAINGTNFQTVGVLVGALQEAKRDLERLSPNPSILGRQDADSSGRAMLVRQQAGMTELWAEFSALEDWTLRTYRQIWAAMRQFLTAPMWVRVSGEDQALEMVMVNDGEGPHLAELDADIVITTSPNTAAIQQEQFAVLADLARSGVQIPPLALIKASSLPDKAEVLEIMQGGQGPDPQQQQAMQLGAEKAQADIRKANASAAKDEAAAVSTIAGLQGLAMPPPGMTGAPGF